MTKKEDLQKKLKELTGEEVDPKLTIPQLEEAIDEAEKDSKLDDNEESDEGDEEEDRLQSDTDESDAPPVSSGGSEDYLRQYEYTKQGYAPYFMLSGVRYVPPARGSRAEKMKKHLLTQPRVRVVVPRKEGEHPSVLHSVNLNGYRLDFPKNKYIELPQQVAELIMESQGQTEAAFAEFEKNFGLDRKKEGRDVSDALSR